MSVFDSVFDGVKNIAEGTSDALFGTPSKLKVKQKTTLTPEQKSLLDSLLAAGKTGGNTTGPLGNTVPGVPGGVETNPIPLENLSLSALEERVKQLAAGGNPLEQATQQQLLDIIKSGGTPTGGQTFEDFFKTNVEDPLTKSFLQNNQQLGTRFGGNALFTSDRQQADARAKDDFLHSLATSRGELAFGERKNSLDNLMQALGLSQNSQGKNSAELSGILQSAFGERQFAQDNASNRFKEWAAQQGFQTEQLNNLIKLIGLPAFENIGAVQGGSSGLLPSLINAGGSIAGASILAGL
jgi:hypothetical protein